MSPERGATDEGVRLAVGLLYLFARTKAEGLMFAALSRAQRRMQNAATRIRYGVDRLQQIAVTRRRR